MFSDRTSPSALSWPKDQSDLRFGVRFDFRGTEQPSRFTTPNAPPYVISMVHQTLLPVFQQAQKLLKDKEASIAVLIPLDDKGVAIDLTFPVEDPECLPKLSLRDSRNIDTIVAVSNAIVGQLSQDGLLPAGYHMLYLTLRAANPAALLPVGSLGCNIGISCYRASEGIDTFSDFRFWDPSCAQWMAIDDTDTLVSFVGQGARLSATQGIQVSPALIDSARRAYTLGLLENQDAEAAAAMILSRSSQEKDLVVAKALAVALICEGYESEDIRNIALR